MSELDIAQLHNTEFPLPADMQGNVAVTSLSRIYNWARRSSMWPLLFGLACCAIEMIATAASRYDTSRFGMEVMRASPRQSDLMIVSGTVTKKMIVPIVRIYNQMPEPKYVMAMGACASGGGPFKEGYNVVSGIDKYIPVDVYVPGCPPTPQALLYGLIALQRRSTASRLPIWMTCPGMVWGRPIQRQCLSWDRILSTRARWRSSAARQNSRRSASRMASASFLRRRKSPNRKLRRRLRQRLLGKAPRKWTPQKRSG